MNASTPAAAPAKPVSAGYRAWVLFVLVIVYTFNFLDRQIIGILAVPIQQELNLTDTQLGLMGGIAFAFLYSTLGVPIAWLADRVNRVWIMGAALTVWSGMTAVCGLAQNFWQIFLARVGVGVGEAGGVAPAYTIIADYFPPEKRASALAIYSFGIPIGSAIGIIFGGVIASLIDWRAAFIIVGLAGVAFAPVFVLTVREPKRGGFDQAPAPAPTPQPAPESAADISPIETRTSAQPSDRAAPKRDLGKRLVIGSLIGAVFGVASLVLIGLVALVFGSAGVITSVLLYALFAVGGALIGANLGFVWDVTAVLLKKWRSFILLCLGAACSSMMGYGLFFWIPSFIVRSYGAELPAFFSWAPGWLIPSGMAPQRELVLMAAYFYGSIVFIGGLAGIALGGVLGDKLGGKKKANYARVPAVAFLITAPLFAVAILAPNLVITWFVLLIPTALGLLWLGPILTAFQHLARPHMRATASSIFLLINNLLGIGGGVYALGAMSDAFNAQFGEESLRYAILCGASLYVVAAIFFLIASRTIERDWET